MYLYFLLAWVLALRSITVSLRMTLGGGSLIWSMCEVKAKDADITQEWSDAFKEKWDAATAGKNALRIHATKVPNGFKFAARFSFFCHSYS